MKSETSKIMRLYDSKGKIIIPILIMTALLFVASDVDRSLVPSSIRNPILEEYSGEQALRHIEMLANNRNRQADEYLDKFFETRYLMEMAEQYGLSDIKVDYFPSGEIWDAEEAELWLIEPVRKKIASLTQVPAALASGSLSTDIESEVIYVGAGRDVDYAGKDVTGKIVMGSGSMGSVFNASVLQRGAAGALGNSDYSTRPGASLDQLSWQRVNPDGRGFGFVLSRRQHDDIRKYFDRGQRVVMRALVKTRTYPYKMNVTSASIPGSDPDAGELIFVAHAFERIGTPGANDNSSGVATILEIGRTLATLIKRGELPQPKRTLRFLWIPEISGSRAFMYKYPELEDKLLVAMNYDMTGPDLEETDTYLRMKMTPDSRPHFINDLIANLLRFTDQTNITTQWGNNGPFNYRLVPFIAGSDHTVFLNAGIAAMQFNHWSDNFYHTSEDRSIHSDPTEIKRVGFMGAAAFYYLANAGSEEAKDLAWESAANSDMRMTEVTRQSVQLLGDDPNTIHQQYFSAQNKITWAFNRAKGTLESVLDLSDDKDAESLVESLIESLEKSWENNAERLELMYEKKCDELGVTTQRERLTSEQEELNKMVPRYLYNYYTDEYRTAAGRLNQFIPQGSPRLTGLSRSEVPNFVNGERSILDIYNAVRAEYGNVTTNNAEWKFAYVITPESPDIDIDAVRIYIRAMEQAGLVEIIRR